MLTLTSLFSLALSSSPLTLTYSIAPPRPVAPALYDGTCFYPQPDPNFRLDKFTGRWFQVAATDVPFTKGCTCVTADYSINAKGNIDVLNTCQTAQSTKQTISGEASSVDKAYGPVGALRVAFPGIPQNDKCAGPNYVVQQFNGDSAIVQAGNFSTLFVLSRKQEIHATQLDQLIKRAGELGSDLSRVSKTTQTGCKFL